MLYWQEHRLWWLWEVGGLLVVLVDGTTEGLEHTSVALAGVNVLLGELTVPGDSVSNHVPG